MNAASLARLLPLAVAAGAIFLAARWTLSQPQTAPMFLRIPGTDREGIAPPTVTAANLLGKLTSGPGQPLTSPTAASWPNFRGPHLDNIALDRSLPTTWPKTAPSTLWSINTGEGYAGPAIHEGRVYLLDYDQPQQTDTLRCLSLADGREIWTRSYGVEVKRNHGMSRTVSAVTDRFVVTLGPKCHVSCADAITGEFRWGIDLVADYKTKVPPWYAGQCPLIDNDRVILAPAGETLLIAVDLATGKLLWKSPNPHKWAMTHSSIVPMNFGGVRAYLYCASGGLAAINAADGSLLWETTRWKVSLATPPPPLVSGDDRILLTGGYGAGSMLLQLKKSDTQITPEVVYQLPPETFGAEQHTPIFYKNFVYGVIPGGQLVCLDPVTGKQLWNSGNQRFGLGPYFICNDQLFLLNDSGALTIAQATPEKFQPLAQWTLINDAHESWGPMALVDGKLLVRDLRHLVCVNLRENTHD